MIDNPKLLSSWADLSSSLDGQRAVLRWAGVEPGLAGLSDTADLLTAWSDRSRTNEVLLALVHLAAIDGHDEVGALQVLLHLLARLVHLLAGQLRDLTPDVEAMVVAELTCQIRRYPWRTRPGSVVANLRLETRRALLADLRPSHRYHPERVERLTWDGVLPEPHPLQDPDDVDLADLLGWAANRGVPAADLALLVATECARDQAIPDSDRVVAARHGITCRTLYRRRRRTLDALRGMVPDYLAATA